jgi:hypothetical protein
MEKQGMQGLVLDLRDNPGGLLRSAVEVSDLFLPGDRLIVYSQGREGVARRRNFYTHADNTHPDLPMVVLINSGSASASEIVSGAMRDHNRATLIGETSYGKGSVQSILPLSSTHNLTRLRLTVAKYFLPLGDCIHGTGVDPDVTIEPENMPSWQVNKILELREKREVEDYVATLWQEALTPITSVMADGDEALGSALRDLNGFNLKRYVNRAARATDTDDLRARTERFAALGRRLRNDATFRQKILSTARADGWRPENPAADILDQLPSIRAHYLRHLTALAEGDGNDPSLYPGFDGFYDSLNAKVPDSFRDTVRREVRRQLRQRVADDRGEEFVYDLQEDLQLQRGVYEILEKLNMPSDQIEDYRTFPAKFTATAEKQPQGEEALK